MPDIKANALSLVHAYFDFISPGTGEQFRPIYTLPLLLLVILGLTRLFTTKYTARSYIIISWGVLLVPIMLINPSKTTLTFVPIMLLLAAGVDVLLYRWYRLFPRNPYARIAGLVPLTLLVFGIALTGIERYFYTYHYNPPVAASFSNDLNLINKQLAEKDMTTGPVALAVTKNELPFYQTVAKYKAGLTLIAPDQAIPSHQTLIATRSTFMERHLTEPSEIITNGRSQESDRLYLYKNVTK